MSERATLVNQTDNPTCPGCRTILLRVGIDWWCPECDYREPYREPTADPEERPSE